MKYIVEFEPQAEADLDDIYEFIAEHNPAAAIAYVRRLKKHCEHLETMPERGPRRDDLAAGVRILPFERRAVVVYKVQDDRVKVLRIYQGGRDYASEWLEH